MSTLKLFSTKDIFTEEPTEFQSHIQKIKSGIIFLNKINLILVLPGKGTQIIKMIKGFKI